jgi:hypothetical protein
MARRNGLEPVVAHAEDGRQLLSRQEVTDLLPQGARAAAFAFDEAEVLYFPRLFTDGSPPLICQVIEQRPAEVEPYDSVQGRVRSLWVQEAALEQAATFAEKVRAAAVEDGLQAAVDVMNGRLKDLLGNRASEDSVLAVKETGFFSRGTRRIQGVEGQGEPVAAEAFSLADGAIGLVTEGSPDYMCYVLKVTETEGASPEDFAAQNPMMRAFYVGDKQQRVLSEWLAGLLADAKPDMRSPFWKESGKPEG